MPLFSLCTALRTPKFPVNRHTGDDDNSSSKYEATRRLLYLEANPLFFFVRQPQTEVATKALNPLEIPFWFKRARGLSSSPCLWL